MIYTPVFMFLSASLVAVGGNFAQICRNVSDCACGQQCVDVMDLRLCHDDVCSCLEGCAVGNIFIPSGVKRPDTYCNWCFCPKDDQDGKPLCTRRQWCDLPELLSVYQENPNCAEEPPYQSPSDCACGQQCVDVMDLRLCHDDLCACLEGCAVGNIFIPSGVRRPDTYCNWCLCTYDDPDGKPVCTSRQWCDLPERLSIYQENPNCGEQQAI